MSVKKKTNRRKAKAAPIDSRKEFEKLLRETDTVQHYQLRLYVTGSTLRSTQAIENIRCLCEEYLKGRYDLEVIDIYQQPKAAADQQIIAAPTLIKELPNPPKRLVGNLSDRDKILIGLNLHKKTEATRWVTL